MEKSNLSEQYHKMEKKSMRKQMTDVEKSIHEESEKISSVKKIVKARSAAIENTQFVPEGLSDAQWKDLDFSNPNATVRIGTVFSGIGAIEHAFQRLKLNHKIVFAGDIDENCRKSYFANYDIKEEYNCFRGRWCKRSKNNGSKIRFLT